MSAADFAERRAASGMTMRAFAKALGIGHATVGRYEAGGFPIPADVARAAKVLAPVSHKPLTEELSYRGLWDSAGAPADAPATGVCETAPEGTAPPRARSWVDALRKRGEVFAERAAIYEFDAGLSRAEAERQAWADVLAEEPTEARQAA